MDRKYGKRERPTHSLPEGDPSIFLAETDRGFQQSHNHHAPTRAPSEGHGDFYGNPPDFGDVPPPTDDDYDDAIARSAVSDYRRQFNSGPARDPRNTYNNYGRSSGWTSNWSGKSNFRKEAEIVPHNRDGSPVYPAGYRTIFVPPTTPHPGWSKLPLHTYKYEVCATDYAVDKLRELLLRSPGAVCDTETCSTNPTTKGQPTVNTRECEVFLSSYFTGEGPVYVVERDRIARLRDWFESGDHKKVGHNLSFDAQVVRDCFGFNFDGFFGDTMYMYWLTDCQYGDNKDDLKLEVICERVYGFLFSLFKDVFGKHKYKVPKGLPKGQKPDASHACCAYFRERYFENGDIEFKLKSHYPSVFDVVFNKNSPHYNRDGALNYAAEDVWSAYYLYQDLKRILRAFGLWNLYVEEGIPFLQILARMEEHGGMALNTSVIEEIQRKTHRQTLRADELFKQRVHPEANMKSPPQMQHIFFTHGEFTQATGFFKKNPTMLSCGCDRPHEFNENNPKHVTDSGKPSAGGERMKELWEKEKCRAAEVLVHKGSVQTIREFADRLLNNSGIEEVCIEDVIHKYRVWRPSWWPFLTTGRTSTGQNRQEEGGSCQNIPKRKDKDPYVSRRAFVARPGHVLVVSDWDQLELRILAHLCRDPVWLEIFAKGIDPHSQMAIKIFKLKCPWEEVSDRYPDERAIAKNTNYGIVYGQTAVGLASKINLPREECEVIIRDWLDASHYVRAYLDECKWFGSKYGYIPTIDGRRRYLPDASLWHKSHGDHIMPWYNPRSLSSGQRKDLNRMCNTPIQGSAGDLMRKAQINISRDPTLTRLGHPVRGFQLYQIHDEMIGEVREEDGEEAAYHLQYQMQNAMETEPICTATAQYAHCWVDAK